MSELLNDDLRPATATQDVDWAALFGQQESCEKRSYLGTSEKTVGSIGHRRTGPRQYLGADEEFRDRRLPIGKDYAMGDKGGKKDKDKSKKQKADKQAQSAKGKQDKTRPK